MSECDPNHELNAAVHAVAANPPVGVSKLDWTNLLAKLIPLIIQIVQVFLTSSVVPTPTPTPTPNPNPTPTP